MKKHGSIVIVLSILIISAFLSCTKNNGSSNTSLPTLTCTPISKRTTTTAMSGGFIANDGGSSIIDRGICWSTRSGPTIDLLTKTSEGGGTGWFTSNMSGLDVNTNYYVRAYATNSAGTNYSNEQFFRTKLLLDVGDLYAGGVVAYRFVAGDSGYSSTQQHCLIASIGDLKHYQLGM